MPERALDHGHSGSRKFDPDWVISPGETLREWIEENGLSVRSTATVCVMKPEVIEGILAGKRKLSGSVAVGLERGTQIPAQLWLNLERTYREGLKAGKKDTT